MGMIWGESCRLLRSVLVGKAGTREFISSKFRSGASRFAVLSKGSYSLASSGASGGGGLGFGGLACRIAYTPRPIAATKATI